MVKRIISSILVFVMLVSTTVTTSAKNVNIKKTKYEEYVPYELALNKGAEKVISKALKNNYEKISALLAQSKKVTKKVGATEVNTYDSKALNDFVSEDIIINAIESINGSFFIDYNISNGERVIAEYHKDGKKGLSIYNIANDSLIVVGTEWEEIVMVNNVKKAVEEIIEPGKLEEINSTLKIGNEDMLNKIEGIDVKQIDDAIIIEPTMEATGASYRDITPSIYSYWPSYTNNIVYTGYKYCSALDTNVKVSVKDSRNEYVRVKYSSRDYLIGTALTTIGLFLGTTAGVVAVILTAANVVYITIGGISEIVENIRLANDVQYDYWGKRNGYVYDTTIYNQDVKVKWNESKGTYDGGYLPNGDWAYIDSPPSAAFDKSISSIADSALSLYNSCIWVYGYCHSYYPE